VVDVTIDDSLRARVEEWIADDPDDGDRAELRDRLAGPGLLRPADPIHKSGGPRVGWARGTIAVRNIVSLARCPAPGVTVASDA
jgi:hypothetical protein